LAAKILVTGDIALDVDVYIGARMTPDSEEPGTLVEKTAGGAVITWNLLCKLAGKVPDPRRNRLPLTADDLVFGIDRPSPEALEKWPATFHAMTLWEAKEATRTGEERPKKRWFPARPRLGYGPKSGEPYPGRPSPDLYATTPRILVIDDGMLGFRRRTATNCWPQFLKNWPKESNVEWVLLKMSSPLGSGDLWHLLAEKWKERLILIVNAEDMRRADVRLARGLSWEQTVEDFLTEIDKRGPLADLCACRHLVVTLASDGALWISQPGDKTARTGQLVFDRKRAEGEFDEEMSITAPYGSLSIMTASIAWRLWYGDDKTAPDLTPALKAGLSASRLLRETGHGLAGPGYPPPSFPVDEVVREICAPLITPKLDESHNPTKDLGKIELARHSYASVAIPSRVARLEADQPGPPGSRPWSILRANTEGVVIDTLWPEKEPLPPLHGAARRLLVFGPGSLNGVPYARFGKLLTMDRGEIESLRSVRQLMVRYKEEKKPKRPLSIAVFGAPGSGKSFGLKQIAEAVFGEKALEFNLSQFKGPNELYGAYHQVRDRVLSGVTPVVFWDEFDSGDLTWLQYLLAPMQDGVFQEGPLTHAIGKCVFVFAGGTKHDYRHFDPAEAGNREDEEDKKVRREFVLKKGPDFKSRVTACLNVPGPNRRRIFDGHRGGQGHEAGHDDQNDTEFPVRRAILLRGLAGVGSHADEDKRLAIDPGLATALLEVAHYRNGARSFEKLVEQIAVDGTGVLSRANLPHRDILELLVKEVDDFYKKLTEAGFGGDVEELAKKIHARYLEQIKGAPDPNPESAKPWDELRPDLKASNRAAAQRITEILAVVGLECVPGEASEAELDAVDKVLKANLDMLAAMEHDGWMDEKRRQGWTFGETRDNAHLKHPLMIPYGDLAEIEKDKDRDSVLRYPKRVGEAGYKIVVKSGRAAAAGG
jgi:hypothetical protein